VWLGRYTIVLILLVVIVITHRTASQISQQPPPLFLPILELFLSPTRHLLHLFDMEFQDASMMHTMPLGEDRGRGLRTLVFQVERVLVQVS